MLHAVLLLHSCVLNRCKRSSEQCWIFDIKRTRSATMAGE